MLGLPYEKPAAYTRDYLEVLMPPCRTRVRSTWRTTPSPCTIRLDLPPVSPLPVLVAALGPVMLQLAGEHADGTVLWMADERAIGDHIAPRITKAAADAGRPAPRIVAGIPVCLCANSEIDAAKERANRILPRPRRRRTTRSCWTAATRATSGTSAPQVTSNRSCADSECLPTPA